MNSHLTTFGKLFTAGKGGKLYLVAFLLLFCCCSRLLAVDKPAHNVRPVRSHVKTAAVTHKLNALTSPVISYSGPQSYAAGTTITPLTPTSSGVGLAGYSLSNIAVGSGLSNPTGVAIDAAGNLYVADWGNNAIKEIMAGSGTIVTLGSGFKHPEGIAVDAAGNVYVADEGNNAVKKIPVAGGDPVTIGSNFLIPIGVAVDAAGNVYVADYGNNQVKKVPAGNGTPVILGSGFTFNQPVAVALDPFGNLYVTDYGTNQIVRIPANGSTITGITGGFNEPLGVSIDASGNLFVCDFGNNELKEVPAVGNSVNVIGSGITLQFGVTTDPAGNVFVASQTQASIQKIVPVGGYYISPRLPQGLVFDSATGTISGTPTALSPATNYTVTAYNSTGSTSATVNIKVNALTFSYSSPQIYTAGTTIAPLTPTVTGGTVATPGYSGAAAFGSGLLNPGGLAADAARNIYVADRGNSLIKKFAAAGGTPVILGSGFLHPSDVKVDAAGNVYVADYGNSMIKEIPVGGGSIITLGSGFNSPTALSLDKAGNIYVADSGNNAVKEIPAGGGTPIVLGPVFNAPSGIALDAAGNIYVADLNNRVSKIPVGGGSLVTVVSGLNKPGGIAIDASGNLFITNTNGGSVQEAPATGTAPFTLPFVPVAPVGVTTDALGNLYVTDNSATVIDKLHPIGGYYISAALPAGLSFANATGTISGKPLAASPATNYKVTGYNGANNNSATVNIKVATSANANLAGLAISSGTLTPLFAAGTTSYTASVSNAIASITITPTAGDPAATIKVNGKIVATGTASGPIALAEGAQTAINTVVTAPDGTTNKTYTITVTRAKSANAKLLSLTTSSGALSPAFNNTVTSYTRAVANTVSSITVKPTTVDAMATIVVNNVAVISGNSSAGISLNVGPNVINTVVTAQDGTTKITYTITVTRAASNDATLSNLTISSGALKPVFATATTTYNTAVGNGVTSVIVTPTTHDPTATVKVNGVTVTSGAASGPVTLVVGPNTINTVVTASNGTTTKIYKITVTRAASGNAKLLSLTTSSGALSPAFNNAITSYTRAVPNATTSITFTPTVVDNTATITLNGITTASGTASAAQSLVVGSNTETITVTAQNGVTSITYVVTVNRAMAAGDAVYEPVSVEKPIDHPLLDDDIIVVHQSLSPNGDNINDFLRIDGILAHPDNKLTIMNRSGQLIFEAKNYDNSTKVFDGHSNKTGAMQLPGTYFYSLDYTVNGVAKHKTGFIVLKY